MRAIAAGKPHRLGCGWFWAWALVGAAFALGVTSLGIFTALPATIAVVLMTRHRPIRGAFGVLTGVGSVLLVVAYVQRQGPGTTCWHTATGSGCDQHLDPMPWLVLGLVSVLAGLVGHAWRSAD